jgi:thymidylate kinase
MGRAENLTRFEQETRDFWKRVHEGYSLMYKDSKNYKNLFVLNGQDTQAGLLVQAQKSLAPLLDVS